MQSDYAIEVETNSYSVPWRLIGERVRITIADGLVRIAHAGQVVATHEERRGRRERALDPTHFAGVVGFPARRRSAVSDVTEPAASEAALLRPLAEYEAVIRGAW